MTELTVTICGPVGSGKSAIAGEIEIAMKAIGVPVRYADEAASQSEKNMTHADWQTYIEMYHPSVVLVEAVDDPMARHLLLGYHQICTEHGIAPGSRELLAAADRATEVGTRAEPLPATIRFEYPRMRGRIGYAIERLSELRDAIRKLSEISHEH